MLQMQHMVSQITAATNYIFNLILMAHYSQEPALEVAHSDLVYDFTWFPDMDSQSPDSCVFATTCGRDSIRLIDAYTGKTRATYRTFDHCERMTTAHSICFSPDGSRIYAGYEKMIRIFRTAVPGTSCDEVSFYGKTVTVFFHSGMLLTHLLSLVGNDGASKKQRRNAVRGASSRVSASTRWTGKCLLWLLFRSRYQFPVNQMSTPSACWKVSGVESLI